MHKVLAVIGTTGVGKSNLAVDLCKALCGQAINSDAMQVYKGLDIITNKITVEERQGVHHHLMDFLDPEDEYKVTEFKNDATQCIEKLTQNQQVPVIVGGTNYYMQSLLWKNMLVKEDPNYVSERSPSPEPEGALEALETNELYDRLKTIDPIMAKKWRISERRKIIRSLNIFYSSGRLQSDIIKEQRIQQETLGAQPRFNSLIFWLYADPVKLNPRLDERVETMIQTGLFDEIKELRKHVVEGSVTMPGQALEKYQRGLWQAIGYKEFDPYFTAVEENTLAEADLTKIKLECTERMKASTRRYARRQVQWIRNKLLPTVWNSKGNVLVYMLDAGDIEQWNDTVQKQAIELAKAFLQEEPMPDPMSLGKTAATFLDPTAQIVEDAHTRILNWKKHVCPVCTTSKGEAIVMNGDNEWEQHQKSRGHRRTSKQKRLKEIKAKALQ
ncbi:putative tRNA isopentenyltransferase [Spinellus fusiger]|nr:putative tRNA isopentenyltransferase [Spinellus fusiger]